MPRSIKIGLNPLPWVLTPAGFDLSIPVLRTAFGEIATTPFRAIQADPPAGLNAAEYSQLLAEFGLEPAPGYFSASFHTETAGRHRGGRETTRRAASRPRQHRGLHRRQSHSGTDGAPSRWCRRKRGDPSPRHRRAGCGCCAITSEGVTPALHPHVGSTVETESEVHAVLNAIPSSDLSFGPDTGHLAWAGMTPSKIMADYADRIVAMHLKDVHLDQADQARAAEADYMTATARDFTIWTEPGRGDVDLVAALDALPDTFSGWAMVEVDVPEAATNLESTQLSAAWVTERLGLHVFETATRDS